MAGVKFHDAACPTGELTLQVEGRAAVLDADQVRRGHVLPSRCMHRLLEDRQALPSCLVRGLSLGIRIAVLEERLGQGVRPDGERAALGIDVEERGGLLAAERGEALPDLGQVARHEQQMADRVDARRCLGGDDAAVAVSDDDGRLIARGQDCRTAATSSASPGLARPAARRSRHSWAGRAPRCGERGEPTGAQGPGLAEDVASAPGA